MKKREFIKYGGLVVGTILTGTSGALAGDLPSIWLPGRRKPKIVLRFKPYELQLKHVFTIAAGSRTTTPVVLTEIEYDGHIGYGEASMPPYLGESHETVLSFLSKVDLSQFNDPFLMDDILTYVDNIMPGNHAAKASVDIALHDLTGKLAGKPWYQLWGLNPSRTPDTSFTIGIDTPDVVKKKVQEAAPYKVLKVKLGIGDDRVLINTIRSVSDKPVCVDVNQGWKDRNYALEMAHWLKDQNVLFIEQPMPKSQVDDLAWLTMSSPVPVIADEAVQTARDLISVRGIYSGVNIKLMKCGGLRPAIEMVHVAKAMGFRIMIGCMTETSCAISAASQLSPAAEWADLDGNLLITNDCYQGTTITNGKITLNDNPGIGVVQKIKIFRD